jgi:hypothetical protein
MLASTWRTLACLAAVTLTAAVLAVPASATAAADPAPTMKAPLAKAAYAGLACDPFDRRLAKTALNNGVGPEARVAAACWQLEWRDRAKAPVPPITVHASKTYLSAMVERVRKGTTAGHRLFGRFADVSSYVALVSRDAAFSCAKGEAIVDGRPLFFNGAWAKEYNSGCKGADYSPSGWTSTILGDGGREYFAWSLTGPDADNHFTDSNTLGPMWFLGAMSHEFVHSIQMQRSLEAKSAPGCCGQESIGRWFGEGQAQYLGNFVAGLTIGPKDIRSAQLRQLRDVMREEKVKTIDLAKMEDDWQTQLVYPAGYFAYEWLVAHYGAEATFTWWNQWNSECERPGSGECWRAKSEELYGMSADELLVKLNTYVNAQVRG